MSSRLDRITDWEEQARCAHYRASEMAKLIQVSDRHLRRYFLELFGLPPQGWINQLRLRKSVVLLRSNGSVKEIGFQLGYRQTSRFCEAFKRTYGVTPSKAAVLKSFSDAAVSFRPPNVMNVPYS